jgi:CheY-like chemotaxis protein
MPKKILLADDSITIQKVVELTFSDGDYEVVAVNNGAKAIQKLSEMRPDIILSDIIMPEKNGYEVCEYVKSHPELRNLPVVLLTGTFEPFDPDRAEKAGCDAVVTKPFESQSLIHKVEELIAASRVPMPASSATIAVTPEQMAGAGSPWEEPAPETHEEPFAAPEPFAHGGDIFGTPQQAAATPTTEMPFESPAEAFGGETRSVPQLNFDELQKMQQEPSGTIATTPPAESSPWDEGPAFGGETRAFPRMSFDELQKQMEQPAAGTPSAPPPPAPAETSPWEEQAPAFGGETRAFPRMSFEELQKQMEQPAAPPAPPSVPAAPWEEEPAFGGETRAFPRMNFDDLQKMPEPEPEPEPLAPETSPWDEPTAAIPIPAPEPPVWDEQPAPEPEPEAPAYAESPFAAPEPLIEPEPEPEPIAAVPEPEPETAVGFAEMVNSQITDDVASSVPSGGAVDLTDEQIERIAKRVVQMMSEQVVRNIAWEVIPDMAEMVVKERIKQLEAE